MMPSPSELVGVLVHYTGRVQGVGFRVTSESIAGRYRVTGTVRNLPDGGVELLAEGTRPDVESFLKAVRARLARYITAESADWQAATGRYTSFDVTG
jgi:acylphosphatase